MSKYADYLYSRGLSDRTIKTFDIGFCDTGGNCSSPSYRPFVDYRFYDTVLFPIKDLYNNIVAVASRSPDVKKYIHSKYTKSKHLFGLDVAHAEILRTRKVFVVEGNFDLLSLHEHGITNAVAMLGSKLSIEQLSLLTRFAEEIIVAADGDQPGRECARKIEEMCKENNINCRQLNLPPGSDPDSFIRTHGADAFLRLQTPSPLEKLRGLPWKRQS